MVAALLDDASRFYAATDAAMMIFQPDAYAMPFSLPLLITSCFAPPCRDAITLAERERLMLLPRVTLRCCATPLLLLHEDAAR